MTLKREDLSFLIFSGAIIILAGVVSGISSPPPLTVSALILTRYCESGRAVHQCTVRSSPQVFSLQAMRDTPVKPSFR
jgi:hypothetical protein